MVVIRSIKLNSCPIAAVKDEEWELHHVGQGDQEVTYISLPIINIKWNFKVFSNILPGVVVDFTESWSIVVTECVKTFISSYSYNTILETYKYV